MAAYIRMFSDTDPRPPAHWAGWDAKVTAIGVFERGPAVHRAFVSAGQVGQLCGLDGIRVGDDTGIPGLADPGRSFAPSALDAVITVCRLAAEPRWGRAADGLPTTWVTLV